MNILSKAFPWHFYSQKFISHISNPHFAGEIKEQEQNNLFRVCIGEEGDLSSGRYLKLYLLIDEMDAIISDVRFEAVGDTAYIGAANALCELLMRKNIEQAARISVDLLDLKLRDDPKVPAFPESVYPFINCVFFALEDALQKCQDLKVDQEAIQSPLESKPQANNSYPGFTLMSIEEKIQVIEEVLEKDIQPYIALDEGGVTVKEYKLPFEVMIAYQGNCTSCYSSIGATLNAIQQILKEKIHSELVVVPDLSTLTF